MYKPKKREIEKNYAKVAEKVAYWTKLSYASIVLTGELRQKLKTKTKEDESHEQQQQIQKC